VRMKWWTAVATALVAMALAAPAANADREPNDGITQVEGPVGGGVTYSGAIGTVNDWDWYFFYATSQTQLDISLTTPGDSPSGCSSRLELRTTNGYFVDDISAGRNATTHLRYTTAVGTNRYLLVLRGCDNTRYQFRIDPGAAIVSGPAPVVPTPTGEPNEFAAQAIGPLAPSTPYLGSLDTQNDIDWFYFHTAGPFGFDLSLIAAGAGSCSVSAVLYQGDGSSFVDDVSAKANTIAHLLTTAPGAATYWIKVTGCTGDAYHLQLDPPSAISLTPPPPPPPPVTPPATAPAPRRAVGPSRRCRAARAAQRRWTRAIRTTRGKLRVVQTRRARRTLKRKLAAQKRTLKRVRDRVTIHCT
jgi:hypothetical protein